MPTSIVRWFSTRDKSSHQAGNQDGDIELTKYLFNSRQRAGRPPDGGNVAVPKRGYGNKTIIQKVLYLLKGTANDLNTE